MSYRQFNRVYRLTVGNASKGGIEITGLKLSFDFEKDLTQEANKGKVTVYNLSEKSRFLVEQPDAVCIFEAGYDDYIGPVKVFAGNITLVSTDLSKTDVPTDIEFVDGRASLRDSTFSAGYAPGVNGRKICEDAAAAMGLTLYLAPDVVFPDYANGFSFAGYAKEAVSKLAAAAGAIWSIQNGVLQVIRAGGTTGAQAVVLSPQSGLIGSPERIIKGATRSEKDGTAGTAAEDNQQKKLGWKIRYLLNAAINPGDIVKVESKLVNGFFRAEKIQMKGDTHGSDWTCEAEIYEVV